MSQTNTRAFKSVVPTVLIEGQPAAIPGHLADHEQPLPSGEPTVLIAGRPAVTMDGQGKPTVLIADRPAR